MTIVEFDEITKCNRNSHILRRIKRVKADDVLESRNDQSKTQRVES